MITFRVRVLVGESGFVGGHISRELDFDRSFRRTNIEEIRGLEVDLLVCAGLPAEKWRANKNGDSDWRNIQRLASALSSVKASRAVLISTVDVYEPCFQVNENVLPAFQGASPYGVNRAWFEAFFRMSFRRSSVIRLPGLFAPDVKKNLVHDLLHQKLDQVATVNANSTFQYFNAAETATMIQVALENQWTTLNVVSEPVTAQDIANIFGRELQTSGEPVCYDVKSIHDVAFGRRDGYLFSAQSSLSGIERLCERWGNG